MKEKQIYRTFKNFEFYLSKARISAAVCEDFILIIFYVFLTLSHEYPANIWSTTTGTFAAVIILLFF
jgi:hypothetical protein